MHTSRTALLIISGLGIISSLTTYALHDKVAEFGMSAFIEGVSKIPLSGVETKYGIGTIVLFAIVALMVIMGDRTKPLVAGSKKFTLLMINGSNVIYHIIVISIFLLTAHKTPAFGLYVAFCLSLAATVTPYLFKKDGKFGPMTPKEIAKDIEDSAEDFEDKAEDLGDKIEDKIEEKFEKKPDKEDSEEESKSD